MGNDNAKKTYYIRSLNKKKLCISLIKNGPVGMTGPFSFMKKEKT